MDEDHSPTWMDDLNCKPMWRCDIDQLLFPDEQSLKLHMAERHSEILTERQLLNTVWSNLTSVKQPSNSCLLCGLHSFLIPPPDGSSPEYEHYNLPAELNEGEPQSKRRKTKTTVLDTAEEGPEITPVKQAQRKLLVRHIAAHLKNLAFVSLRLDAFGNFK